MEDQDPLQLRQGTAEDDTWHLPDGRTLHVLAEKRPDGGITYLFVDETERLALERDYNALIGVQRETLDSLKEGVAVFGTDGRLKLFNSAFAEIWQLSRRTLAEEPHIDEFILQAAAPLMTTADLGASRAAPSRHSPSSASESRARWCGPTAPSSTMRRCRCPTAPR